MAEATLERCGTSAVHPSWVAALLLAALGCLLAGCQPEPRSFVAVPGFVPVQRDSAAAPGAPPQLRVALLPLANYTARSDAPDRVGPMIAAELSNRGVFVTDPGVVQAALEQEPWLLLDRVPPDLVDRLGDVLKVDGLLVGSLLTYGDRDSGGEKVPQVSLAVRFLQCPGGRVLWSAVHSRDGDDGEWLFGLGKVHSIEQLGMECVHELLERFPAPSRGSRQ